MSPLKATTECTRCGEEIGDWYLDNGKRVCIECDAPIKEVSKRAKGDLARRHDRALLDFLLASQLDDVTALRQSLLDGELLDLPGSGGDRDAAQWLKERVGGLPAVLAYAGWQGRRAGVLDLPVLDGGQVWIRSSEELEPLRLLAERLVGAFGWWPAEAVIFLVTGDVMPCGGVLPRRTDTRTFSWAGQRRSVTRQVPDIAAAEGSERARESWGQRIALVQFAESYGTGEEHVGHWRRIAQAAGWSTYEGRRQFYRATRRAQEALADQGLDIEGLPSLIDPPVVRQAA